MVLKLGRSEKAQPVMLPWESIDSQEAEEATNWEGGEKGDWFLDAPKGEWDIEIAAKSGDNSPDEAEEDDRAVPLESMHEVEDEEPAERHRGAERGGWTFAVLCMGLGILGACILIPQADANRRLVYEREKLRLDLTQVQRQIAVNSQFLDEMERDPQLTERLAQREMHAVKEGENVVNTSGNSVGASATARAERMSPFGIVNVPPPPALAPYQPVGGLFAGLCRDPKSHLYVLGAGMLLVAGGLTLGGSSGAPPSVKPEEEGEDFSDEITER